MINVLIQVFSLLNGLLVNFVIPALYGLEVYGAFIQAQILVFVFQKLTDIVNEPLISVADPPQVFPLAAATAAAIWLLFSCLNRWLMLGSPLLLATMLASACAVLGMYSLRWHRMLLGFLVVFPVVFLSLLGVREKAHWSLDIAGVLAWTNAVTTLPVLIPLVRRSTWRRIDRVVLVGLRAAPRNVSVTLVFNLLTNILPYLLSRVLSHTDLGLFRVTTSVVQSASSLFPFNIKAMFVMFHRRNDADALYLHLLGFALLWFSGIGFGGLFFASIFSRITPFLALVGALPILYWAMLSERYLLADGRRRALTAVNLCIGISIFGIALWVHTLAQAMVLYAASIAIYALCTVSIAVFGMSHWQVFPVVVSMPFAVYLQSINMFAAMLWQVALMVFAWWGFGMKLENIRHIGEGL